MDKEIKARIDNIDQWIKQIHSEIGDQNGLLNIVQDTSNNTQHNYELILALKEEIEQLKADIRILKMLHLMDLKEKMEKVKP